MGDEKIVPGTEVVFETADAQADGNQPSSPEPREESPDEITWAVGLYARSYEFAIKNHEGDSIDLIPLGNVIPYLRFTKMMNMTALPIPKDCLMGIMVKENPKLQKLLEGSDLQEALPESYDFHIPLPAIAEVMGVPRTLNVSEALKKLERVSQTTLTLYSGYPLSLFIEDGQTYRRYEQRHGDRAIISPYTYIKRGLLRGAVGAKFEMGKLPTFFPSDLESFIRTTGHKNVQRFLTDLTKLDEELHREVKEESVSGVVKVLYNRLKKYHPELTI